jgi:hypothetical protein
LRSAALPLQGLDLSASSGPTLRAEISSTVREFGDRGGLVYCALPSPRSDHRPARLAADPDGFVYCALLLYRFKGWI